MNPLLARLQPYPFERWRELTRDIRPPQHLKAISLGIGEPRHPTAAFIENALTQALSGLSSYPATAGDPNLRQTVAQWCQTRYGVQLDPATQVLPVTGTREALFAIAQTVVDASKPRPTVVCPNPFYQIYEGAALLAGARTAYANSDPQQGFAARWDQVDESTWADTQLLYVCSPGNPTGAVMPLHEWAQLFELSDRHGFVIASDECYSEIFFGDDAPLGSLQAAYALGRHDLRRLLMFTSLSKRSNVPGMRSGFVAGDAQIIRDFLLYRTYHGSAMSPVVQRASIAAWSDEAHVQENRRLYREKFSQITPLLSQVMRVSLPDAGFYLWPEVPGGDDVRYAQQLLAQYNVTVVPGSLLARTSQGINPGAGRVRMALVASVDECLEAAHRIISFTQSYS